MQIISMGRMRPNSITSQYNHWLGKYGKWGPRKAGMNILVSKLQLACDN